MKKTALLVLALYANSIYTDEYIFFDGTQDLYNEVAKKSSKLRDCLEKHQLMPLDPACLCSPDAIHELIEVSKYELEGYPILKKQFVSDLLLDLAMERFDAGDYTKSEYFCDLAIATDPENPLPYPCKAHFCRQAGNEAQAIAYEKIAKEKGIDRY